MSLSTAELDRLCGGAPTESRRYPVCEHSVGPYYSRSEARDALADHFVAAHPVLLQPMQPRHLPNAQKNPNHVPK